MIPVSDDFLAEVQRSHVYYTYVDVVGANGQTYRLKVTDGSVTADRTAAIRRYGSLSCIDPSGQLTPQNSESILTPYGSYVLPYRGVAYKSGPKAGSFEVVQLGKLYISNASCSDSGAGASAISITAYDPSRKIQRSGFTDVYAIATGYSIIQAIKDLVNRTLDDIKFDAFSSTAVTTQTLTYDSNTDPWAAITELATSIGCEVYFENDGVTCKIAPPVDVDHLPAPCFSFVEGPSNTLTAITRVFDDSSPGFNGVVMVGQSAGNGTTPPVRSVQWDTNPNSPTYYLGPYDRVPQFLSDNTITTQAAADTAAIAQLNLILGFLDQVGFNALVNPALEPDDVVSVQRTSLGINAPYAISSLTIPFSASAQSSFVLRQLRTSS